MNFEFISSTRLIFGPGTFSKAGAIASGFGKRALVTYGVPSTVLGDISANLNQAGLEVFDLQVQTEPTIELIQKGLALARQNNCDVIIGLGGGSAIDTGKAIAALTTNPGDLYNYLEVIGKGQPILNPSAPFIAIPTTAGTGAEVTSNAVISAELPDHPGRKIKVSLRSPSMQARLAILDPMLTLDLPASVTASTGLDALTQLIEPYVSNRANPMTDALCCEGMQRASIALRNAYFDGKDVAARENMLLASLFSGIALANAKLGAVHGFAAPIGGLYSASHGAVCARLLPLVMQTNIHALNERQKESHVIRRYQQVAQFLTGKPDASAEDGVFWVQSLVTELKIPGLSEYGMTAGDIADIVPQAARASSMQGNPIKLTDAELSDILYQAL